MKKIIGTLFTVCLFSISLLAQDFVLGEEQIKPIIYPKFSMGFDFAMWRNFYGFGNQSLRYNLSNNFGGFLAFETGLLKYMNAGAMWMMTNFRNIGIGEPFHNNFSLFAKPFIHLSDNFCFFGRFNLGISSSSGSQLQYLGNVNILAKKDLRRVYVDQPYDSGAYGGMTSASIGAEFFLFSRLGLAFEAGFRTEILRNPKTTEQQGKTIDIEGAPSAINYMIYSIPLSIMLHAIL